MKPSIDNKVATRAQPDDLNDIEAQALAEAAAAQQKPDPDELSGLEKPR